MNWNFFISAISWKIQTCVAWQLSSSWLLWLSLSTRLFCTHYKKTDKILRPLDVRISFLLNSLFHIVCTCYAFMLFNDTTYKKPFPSFPHSLQLFLLVKLAVSFAAESETCWTTPSMYKSFKKKFSKTHRKKIVATVLTISVVH